MGNIYILHLFNFLEACLHSKIKIEKQTAHRWRQFNFIWMSWEIGIGSFVWFPQKMIIANEAKNGELRRCKTENLKTLNDSMSFGALLSRLFILLYWQISS